MVISNCNMERVALNSGALFGLILSVPALSSTPSEMAGFSLQDLLDLPTEETKTASSEASSPWELELIYSRKQLSGYRSGTRELSNREVLFTSGQVRTDQNFPVVPTEITQEATIANISYAIDKDSGVSLSIPYIRQSTDHVSAVEGYDSFLITSEGLGDIFVNYSRVFKRWDKQQMNWVVGLSIPCGSIDQEGDTPRAPGDQQLPYTMQLGSGTWDIPLGFRYQNSAYRNPWGVNFSAKLRLGENDRDYRLGNRYSVSAWTQLFSSELWAPHLKVHYVYWDAIRGQDNDLTVPNPNFPYPAAITNPDNYGGEKINIALSSNFYLGSHSVTAEIGTPVYQDLNGIQNDESMNLTLKWGFPI